MKKMHYLKFFIFFMCFLVLSILSGTYAANEDTSPYTRNSNVLFYDDCTSITQSGWIRYGTSSNVNFIGDSTESEKFKQHIPVQQYMFYGSKKDSITSISKNMKLGNLPWCIKFDTKISSLNFPVDNNGGFVVLVNADKKQYKISLNSMDSDGNLKICVLNDIKQIHIDNPKILHSWKISCDGDKKIYIFLDNAPVAQFLNGNHENKNLDDSVMLSCDMRNSDHGKNEIYIKNFTVSRSYLIKNCVLVPGHNENSLSFIVDSTIDDKSLFYNGSLTLKAILYNGNTKLMELAKKQQKEVTGLSFNSVPLSGNFKIVLQSFYGDTKIQEFTKRFKVKPSENIDTGQYVDADPGKVYWFNSVDKMISNSGKIAENCGWKKDTFKYPEQSNTDTLIYNSDNAEPLTVPVNLNGWMGIYVGYESDTNGFKIAINDASYTINTSSEISENMSQTLSPFIKEKFISAYYFKNNSIIISPLDKDKHNTAKISYIKFVGLTPDQVQLFLTADENNDGKRLMYDNDGYTGFFNGSYSTVEALKKNSVDYYKNCGIGEINWCLGSTGMLNYNSKYAGKAFNNISKYNHQLRDGDKTAINQILNILSHGKSPLEYVAEEGKDLNVKVNASLRMNSYYESGIWGFFNGEMYDNYKDCLQLGNLKLSYYYPKFRTYIKNILIETSSFSNVSGVTLDFCRYPQVMGSEATLDEKINIMNEFMHELKSSLPKGKTITVRIPCENPKLYGLDVENWIKEGLIDRIIPSSVSNESFFSIKPFVNMVKGSNVQLYAGITADLNGHDITKEEENLAKLGLFKSNRRELKFEQYLLRAYDSYAAGADGIALFNIQNPINSEYSILSDKVKVLKWHEFQYPSDISYNGANIETADSN